MSPFKRPGHGPRQQQALLQAVARGRVVQNASGDWRYTGRDGSGMSDGRGSPGKVRVAKGALAALVADGLVQLDGSRWTATEAGMAAVEQEAAS